MSESFLPTNYVQPSGSSKYLKLQQGANRFRILSNSIQGWEDWTLERKPLRTKDYPAQLVDITKPAKHFWAFVVWDYSANDIKILELTQRTIQDAIMALYMDDNWGDPKGYDISITKTGEKMETKYVVMPTPPKPVAGEIKAVYIGTEINLEALFSGGDPFAVKQTEQSDAGIISYGGSAVGKITDRKTIEQAEINQSLRPGMQEPSSDREPMNVPW